MADTVPVPEKVVKGRLSHTRGKYVLTVGRKKVELPIGPTLSEREAKAFVGKDLAVIFSRKSPGLIVALGKWTGVTWRPPIIVCYKPAPILRDRLDSMVRREVLAELGKEGLISPALGRQIGAGIAGR